MTILLRLSKKEEKVIKSYAKFEGISVSGLFRQSFLEKITDEYDLITYNKSLNEYRKKPLSILRKK